MAQLFLSGYKQDTPDFVSQIIDSLWGVGMLIILLQLATVGLPSGEPRDWTYYFLIAGWAAFFITSGFVGRLHWFVDNVAIRWCKTALAVYAVAALTYYFIPPLISSIFLWVWLLSLAVAIAWVGLLAVKRLSIRIAYTSAMMWFLLCAFSLSESMIYGTSWFGLMLNGGGLKYAVIYVLSLGVLCPIIYVTLRKPCSTVDNQTCLPLAIRVLLHVLAIYCLIVPLFSTEILNGSFAYHHWKAFLESAASVRNDGWLLWDTPSQYGFLQTLIIAWFPGATIWQSFYVLNAALLCLSGYLLFAMFFTKYNSLLGFVFSLIIALSCTKQLLSGYDPRFVPSHGTMRFLWVYILTGYIYFNYRCFFQTGKMPWFAFLGGNMIWLASALWSLESAIFATIIWLPSLALFSVTEILCQQANPPLADILKRGAKRFLHWLILVSVAISGIALFYYIRLGHLPDMYLYIVYSTSYTDGFNAFPILHISIAACWLYIFAMIAVIARGHVTRASFNAKNVLIVAVLYALLSSLWAISSVYIPISNDGHLICTFPVMVYLSVISMLLLPTLELPTMIKYAYEKGITVLYCVIILCTVYYFNPDWYRSEKLLSPVTADITAIFPTPPQWMQDIVTQANLPPHANVLILAVQSSLEEGAYFHDLQLQPWLLPNTVVAYNEPLSHALYQLLAERRAQRMPVNSYGWVIERKDNPLENYPWIGTVITKYYWEVSHIENAEYRIHKYVKFRP